MLSQPSRNALAELMTQVIPAVMDCKNLINSVRPGSWERLVRLDATYANALPPLIDAADSQRWLRDLVQRLADQFAARFEFAGLLAEIDRSTTPKTVADPFQEVLLDGGRPFVNRSPLRANLLDLTNPAGAAVLLVDGAPKTGKTFSFYLINHVAPTQGYIVSKFTMSRLPKPDDLAGDVLSRIGVFGDLPPIGRESAERWAEKLADLVAAEILERNTPRLFVFDEFTETPLPEGTASFIVRLATYADEELRSVLRVVLVRFPGDLPQNLDDVALRDDAKPFTTTDMVALVMQICKARQWSVSADAVKTSIDAYEAMPGRTLNDRFKFLRSLLAQLGKAAQVGTP